MFSLKSKLPALPLIVEQNVLRKLGGMKGVKEKSWNPGAMKLQYLTGHSQSTSSGESLKKATHPGKRFIFLLH